MPDRDAPLVDLDVTSLAVGGDGVGRMSDGRAVFVPGSLPGDRVAVELTGQKRRYARARIVHIVKPSSDRVSPPCPETRRGCGGCGLAHAAPDAQRRLKSTMVRDALERIGGLAAPEVRLGPPLDATGGRTTIRVGIDHGAPALRRAASNELIAVESCAIAHPLIDEIVRDGRFPGASQVILRCGARTGERLAVIEDSGDSLPPTVPPDCLIVTSSELDRGAEASIHEVVADRRWQISARSFFQSRPDGADLLVGAVAEALDRPDATTLLDAYCGVGLLSAAVPGARVVGVEANRSSVADARVNLADRDAEVVRVSFERWRPSRVEVAIADPSRSGLGRAGIERLVGASPEVIALVSCDAGSLGRDARLLGDAGYRFDHAMVLDLFPQTPHVEVVSRFTRPLTPSGGSSQGLAARTPRPGSAAAAGPAQDSVTAPISRVDRQPPRSSAG